MEYRNFSYLSRDISVEFLVLLSLTLTRFGHSRYTEPINNRIGSDGLHKESSGWILKQKYIHIEYSLFLIW